MLKKHNDGRMKAEGVYFDDWEIAEDIRAALDGEKVANHGNVR